MATSMPDAASLAQNQAPFLLCGQSVHVGAKGNYRPWPAKAKHCNNAVARRLRDIEPLEVGKNVPDEARRLHSLNGKFGMVCRCLR